MVGVKASSTSRLRKRRQIYDQQVYKQMLKGLERKITSKHPNPMTAEPGIVQGKWSAMKGQAYMLRIWLLFLQTEGQAGWTIHPAQSGISSLLFILGRWGRPGTEYLDTSESGLSPAVFLSELAKLLILQCSWGFALQNGLEAKGKQTDRKISHCTLISIGSLSFPLSWNWLALSRNSCY